MNTCECVIISPTLMLLTLTLTLTLSLSLSFVFLCYATKLPDLLNICQWWLTLLWWTLCPSLALPFPSIISLHLSIIMFMAHLLINYPTSHSQALSSHPSPFPPLPLALLLPPLLLLPVVLSSVKLKVSLFFFIFILSCFNYFNHSLFFSGFIILSCWSKPF